jgi:hypothetical protein
MPVSSKPEASDDRHDGMRPSYIRVLIVWIVTLLSLFAFQEYFR